MSEADTTRAASRDLESLRALSDAATPGPWTLCPDLSGCDCGHGTASIDARDGNVVVAEFRDLTDPPNESESNNTEPVETRRANARLIVAAVEYVRAALRADPPREEPTLPDELDAAWKRAEAALPERGGAIELTGRADLDYTAKVRLGRVYGNAGFRGKYVGATAATPAAALLALAAILESGTQRE